MPHNPETLKKVESYEAPITSGSMRNDHLPKADLRFESLTFFSNNRLNPLDYCWPIAKAVSLNFRHPNSHTTCDFYGDLVREPHDKTQVFASRFAFSYTLSNCLGSAVSFSLCTSLLPPIGTRKIPQKVRSLIVCKPLGSDGIPPISLQMCPRVGPYFKLPPLSFSQPFYLSDSVELRQDPPYS